MDHSRDRRTTSPTIFTCAELADYVARTAPDSYLVEGLFDSDGLYLVAGDAKLGKSVLLTNLAAKISSGNSWLGRQVRQGNVLWLAYEESHRERERVYSQYDPKEVAQIITAFHCGYVDTVEGVAAIESLIEEHKPVLLVVDPLVAASSSMDFDRIGDGRSKIHLLKELASKCGICILVVHHMSKSFDGRPAKRVSIAGSHQLVAAASGDVVVSSRTSKDNVRHLTLDITARGVGFVRILVSSQGVSDFHLSEEGERRVPRALRKRTDSSDAKTRICALIRGYKEPTTQDGLIAATGLDRSTVSKACRALVQENQITWVRHVKTNYYTAVEEVKDDAQQ